MDAPGPVPSVD